MQQFDQAIKLLEQSSLFYIVVLGMDSNYTYVSPNYSENFNFLDEDLVGKPYYITMHPDDTLICQEVGAKCFENPGKLLPATLRKHDGKGGYVYTQWEFRALFTDNYEPEGIICIGYNITEQVDAFTKLLKAETEIEDKTGKLNEIGFIQSHVIRRPLANIMGLSMVLTTMHLDEESQEVNTMLMRSAGELDDVVREIVDKTA